MTLAHNPHMKHSAQNVITGHYFTTYLLQFQIKSNKNIVLKVGDLFIFYHIELKDMLDFKNFNNIQTPK